jgi:HPt (histidine-containing phosphotransfer) domain-containing protein
VSAAPSVIDWDQLGAIADGWPEDFVEIYNEFLVELPADLKELGEAIRASDVQKIAALAHRTKGCAANFGFQGVREAALGIENLAKTNSLDGMVDLLQSASEAFESGVREVETVRARGA